MTKTSKLFCIAKKNSSYKAFWCIFLVLIGLYINLNIVSATDISTWAGLESIKGNLGGSFTLTQDLNSSTVGYDTYVASAEGGTGWYPIGNASTPFTGTFDGNGHIISDLYINRAENSGLFGENEGYLVNITLRNISITASASGGITYKNDATGTINYSSTGGIITCSTANCAGVIGYNEDAGTTIINSYSFVNVTSSNNYNRVGGLVGEDYLGTITNCYSYGYITDTNGGGLVGFDNADSGIYSGNFWDNQTSGKTTSDVGTGKTTAQMKTLSTFTGASWDIADIDSWAGEIWFIDSGVDYPRLWSEYSTYIRGSGINVTLNSPGNNNLTINKSITFNCSAIDNIEVKNVSLYIDDTLNYTQDGDSSDFLGLYTIVNGIDYGSHNWTCKARDNQNNEGEATAYNFNISTYVENSQTYSAITSEGSTETFSINILYDEDEFSTSQVKLYYNGTGYVGSRTSQGNNFIFNRSIVIPSVISQTDFTFYWEIGLYNGTWNYYNSSSNTQTVTNISIDDCTSFSTLIYNFTIYDEETKSKLSNTTMEIQVSLYDTGKTIEVINYSNTFSHINPVTLCLENSLLTTTNYSSYVTVKYSANDTTTNKSYTTEYYNILNGTLSNSSSPNKIALYDLNSYDSTPFKLTFRDSSYVLASNILVQLQRQYVADNDFKVVEAPLTDSNGQVILNMVRNTVLYNIVMVDEGGKVVATFNRITAFCKDFTIGECTINLDAPPTGNSLYDYNNDFDVSFTEPSYSSDTNLITMDFITGNLLPKTITMEIIRNNDFGNRSVCTDSLTSSTGTLSCDVSAITDSDQFLFIKVYVDGSLAREYTINLNAETLRFGVLNGSFLAFLIILFLICMFMEDKSMLVISLGLGWVVIISLGLINGSLIGISSAGIWLLVTIAIFLWKLNKEEEG